MKLRIVPASLLLMAAWALAGCLTQPNPSAAGPTATNRIALANLPEAVTSFGAVTSGDWLYVFGGHRGERHDYSADMVSGSFHRMRLSDGRTWERLPNAAPAQGLPLVTHGGFVYRIGGMAARNPAGAKQDLFSMTLVERFDPRTRHWEAFVPLPSPRSSHDAVTIGHWLYVAGGWQLSGGTNKPAWPAHALELNLENPEAGWKEIPQPFQRRAIAVAAVGSRLYCIGGMNSDNQPTLAVDIYDTAKNLWTKGPDLPPGPHKGFSCSAITQSGHLYASTFQGDLLRLAPDERSWEIVGRLERPRLAHRLVTAGTTKLIALGGEDSEGKRPELELLNPLSTPKTSGQTASTTTTSAR